MSFYREKIQIFSETNEYVQIYVWIVLLLFVSAPTSLLATEWGLKYGEWDILFTADLSFGSVKLYGGASRDCETWAAGLNANDLSNDCLAYEGPLGKVLADKRSWVCMLREVGDNLEGLKLI